MYIWWQLPFNCFKSSVLFHYIDSDITRSMNELNILNIFANSCIKISKPIIPIYINNVFTLRTVNEMLLSLRSVNTSTFQTPSPQVKFNLMKQSSRARYLIYCSSLHILQYLVCARSEGSDETMRILNVHMKQSSRTRYLIYCSSLHILQYLVCTRSEGSDETMRTRRAHEAIKQS